MTSRHKEFQEDAKLRVFKIISANPQMASHELVQKVGISNDSAYYLLTSHIDIWFVRLSSLK